MVDVEESSSLSVELLSTDAPGWYKKAADQAMRSKQ